MSVSGSDGMSVSDGDGMSVSGGDGMSVSGGDGMSVSRDWGPEGLRCPTDRDAESGPRAWWRGLTWVMAGNGSWRGIKKHQRQEITSEREESRVKNLKWWGTLSVSICFYSEREGEREREEGK